MRKKQKKALKKILNLEHRLEITEQIISRKVIKADIRHLEYTDIFEIVAMFHIENRVIMHEDEYYQLHTDMNTITGTSNMEYYCRDMKRVIVEKMSQLLCDGVLDKHIKIYINHPMKVRKH